MEFPAKKLNFFTYIRDAAGFSNPGRLAVIGLTELPNSGWAKATLPTRLRHHCFELERLGKTKT